MTVGQLIEENELQVFHLAASELPVTGDYAGDLLSWVMGAAQSGDAWLTIMSNVNVAAVAVLTEVSCVILTEGVKPDRVLLEKCKIQGVNLLGSSVSTFPLAGVLQAQL